jgi:hypothetical protein
MEKESTSTAKLSEIGILSALSTYLLSDFSSSSSSSRVAHKSSTSFGDEFAALSAQQSEEGSDESAAYNKKPKDSQKRTRKKIGELPEHKQDAIRAANRISAKRHRVQSTSKVASAHRYVHELNKKNQSLKSSVEELEHQKKELTMLINEAMQTSTALSADKQSDDRSKDSSSS